MVGLTRDRAMMAHRSEKARAWAGRGSARTLGRSDSGGGHYGIGHAEGQDDVQGELVRPSSRLDWARRVGLLLGIVLLVAVGGAVWQWWRVPGPMTGHSVVVIWHQPGQEISRISFVDRDEWQNFVASQQANHLKTRQMILDQARAEMEVGVHPLFDDMKGRIKDYTSWFYFFPTTYRMAFAAGIAALSQDANDQRSTEQAATEAINQLLQSRFVEVVVTPEHFGPAVEEKARGVLQHAIASELTAAEAQNQTLATFMGQHGHAADGGATGIGGDQVTPVVLSWEALGRPASASSMAAPPDANQLMKGDPAFKELTSSVGAEGTMLVARQVARRVTQVAVNRSTNATLMPMLAGGVLGPAEVVVAPLLGIAAFGMGIGAELGTVKLRQAVEGPALTAVSESVVDHLKESQTRTISDAVVKRVDDWLGG
jgi:hypothetical protein